MRRAPCRMRGLRRLSPWRHVRCPPGRESPSGRSRRRRTPQPLDATNDIPRRWLRTRHPMARSIVDNGGRESAGCKGGAVKLFARMWGRLRDWWRRWEAATANVLILAGGLLIGYPWGADFPDFWRAALVPALGGAIAMVGVLRNAIRAGKLRDLEITMAYLTPFLPLLDRGKFVAVDFALDKLEEIFAIHLDQATDPCFADGRRYPCDVVYALAKMAQAFDGSAPVRRPGDNGRG